MVIKMVRAHSQHFVRQHYGDLPESLLPGGLCDKLGGQWEMVSSCLMEAAKESLACSPPRTS